MAGRIWAINSAVNTAMRTNALLRERSGIKDAGLDLLVTPAGGIAMAVVVRF